MENSKNKFDLSMAYTVPIENLRVGSVFFEDTSPEVWEVTGNHFNPDVNADFTDVKLIGYLDGCEGDLSRIGKTDAFALVEVIRIQRAK